MNQTFALSACALAACLALGDAHAQDAAAAAATTTTEQIEVVAKRETRVSKGATGLPMAIKDTPQSISTLDEEDLSNYALAGSNDALRLATGINIEQYETNRATFNSRGFEIQLTQLDGLGMTNDWGTVVGQLDTFLFERIELIRGANGLLTGVGNASGTVNYVRKRPTNKDEGEVFVSGGSYNLMRAGVDYNKVLTQDGAWAGRIVIAHDDKDSHIRALHDRRTSVYGVVDGQIGDNGVLTIGVSSLEASQTSPMWGSLTLNYADGTRVDFDTSASTSQDWTFWDTRSQSAFVEYTHSLGASWEAKFTFNHRRAQEEVRLLYAFPFTAGLNPDNTGLFGWPYGSYTTTENNLLDVNLSGSFKAFGRQHSLIAGISHSKQKTATDTFPYDTDTYQFLPLPAFPYEGDVYPEPEWGPRTPTSGGEQTLTRLYAAGRFALTDQLKLIGGVNAIKLQRKGSSRYGNVVDATDYPDTDKLSPYLGLTFDFTPDVLGYVSYSDIFQNQDQTDFEGDYLAPTKGVNYEVGVKADWFGKKLLTTFAIFSANQKGLATEGGQRDDGTWFYVPEDVTSKGVEFEAMGKIGKTGKLSFGATHMELSTPDGVDKPWIPRTTVNLRYDIRLESLHALNLGIAARWQSGITNPSGLVKQESFFLADAFAAYDITDRTTVRLNVNNLFNEKYVRGLAYGAIYGAPRNASVSLSYKF